MKWLSFLFLAVIWGSSFILMKKGLSVYNSFEIAAFRMFLASLVMLPIAIKNIKQITKHNILWLSIVGFLGSAIPAFLFPLAQTKIDSSMVGIINSLVPLFTLIIAIVFFKKRPVKHAYIGIGLGLIGAVGLIGNVNIGEGISITYALLPVLATIFYATSVNVLAQKLNGMKSLVITALSFMLVLPFSLVVLLASDFIHKTSTAPNALAPFLYITFLGLVGTALAIIVFNNLIKSSGGIFASSVTYFIPIVAVFWGVLDGEFLGLNHLLFMVLILLGVYLVNYQKKLE